MGVSDILMALIGGAIIGLLGKWLAPGERDVPLWATVLCGIGGIVLGNWLYSIPFNPKTNGIDWWRHVWQVVAAAVLVVFATRFVGRKKV